MQGGMEEQWPEFGPDPELKVQVQSGTLSLTTPSKLKNYGDFDLTGPNIRALVFKNGTYQAEMSINSSDGNLSLSSFSVSTDDLIEFRFVVHSAISTPWVTRFDIERVIRLKVPSGDSTTTFNASTNTMPIPAFEFTFGWDANDKLKVGFSVSSDDGASQDLTVITRLTTCPDDSSSTVIDLDSSSTQSHTSNLTQWEGGQDQQIEVQLKSSTSDTRQEERWRLTLCDRLSIPGYPASFPSVGVRLQQTKVGSGAKLARPA